MTTCLNSCRLCMRDRLRQTYKKNCHLGTLASYFVSQWASGANPVTGYFACGSDGEVLWWARLCVCLSVHEDVSRTTCAIFTKFFVNVVYGRCVVLLWRDDEIPRGIGNFGDFYPIDNALHSIAFSTHTKRLNRSTCRLGWWVGLARGTVCYVGWWSPKGKGQFWVKTCLTSLIPLVIANCTGLCSGRGQMVDCKHWTSLLLAARWGCTSGFLDDIMLFFYSGPYSDTIFAAKDQFCLHLLVYHKFGENSISYY